MRDGVLWKKHPVEPSGLQLIVPISMQKDILKDLHEGALGGHLGAEKMINKQKERFCWPSCTDDVPPAAGVLI